MRRFTNEAELLAAFTQGNSEAFAVIFHSFCKSLNYFARKLVPSEEAEDIVSETFAKLWKLHNRLHNRFQTLEEVKRFLYILTRNACLDYLRSRKIKLQKYQHFVLPEGQGEEVFNTLEIESDFLAFITEEIKKLPPRQSQVFALGYLKGYKNDEIAKMLRISIKTVTNLKTMALKKIKFALFLRKSLPG